MGAWDHGLFANDHDQDTISELNEEIGLGELFKSMELSTRVKDGELSAEAAENDEKYYTICGGGDAPDAIRKHLDSGVLEKLLAKKEQEMLHPSKNAYHPDYTFVLLGACAMSLGCRILPHYKMQMQKHFLDAGFPETQERQLFKALNGPDGYVEGTPYEFELPADVVEEAEKEMKRREAKGIMLINVPAPFGLYPMPPPKNKTLRAEMDEGKYGRAACGGCGAQKQKDGGTLLQCSKCRKRGYCGTQCQKEHWKLHKKVCVAAGSEQGSKSEK